MAANGKFKLGFCQTAVSKDKATSLANAKAAVEKAVGLKADVVVLGEMFSCPYATKFFREYGERLIPTAAEAVLDKVRSKYTSSGLKFEEVIAAIESAYTFKAGPFTNGSTSSAAGENGGSSKILSFGWITGLSEKETLVLFGQHYRDVVASPEGTSHGNIRAFMKTGWGGVTFPQGVSLTPVEGENATQSITLLSKLARDNKIWLFGGSVPELEFGKVYNTCFVFNPDGRIVARHRKTHLFDIDVAASAKAPAMKFSESDVLSAGDSLTFVDLPWCRTGVGICYDMRFPEMALAMREQGAKLLIYPGAFNTNTGPAHWSVLGRGRAVDTQSYVAMVCPARSTNPDDYQAYGHSMVITPWAVVMTEAEHEVGVWVSEIDPSEVDRIRAQVPTSNQKRGDIYAPYANYEGGSKRARSA